MAEKPGPTMPQDFKKHATNPTPTKRPNPILPQHMGKAANAVNKKRK
jgi:hypothetical protein